MRYFKIPLGDNKSNRDYRLKTVLLKSDETEKERYENNSSSTQTIRGKREKIFLTTQENF